MRIFAAAFPPYGFVQFCASNPVECRIRGYSSDRIAPTPEQLSVLDAVNRQVNGAVEPATDLELYGVTEYWTIPTNRGDCEDYALLKRRLLIERGWPSSALLMTVVRDEQGEGHAVLTVRTTLGDFVLDNKAQKVKLWNETPYRFVMRQSYLDPTVWMSLAPNESVEHAPYTSLPADH